jgi:hypothetical protein
MLIDNENYQNLQFFKANGFRKLKEQLNRIPGESKIIQFVALANGMLGAFVETVEPVVKVKVKEELAEETKTEMVEGTKPSTEETKPKRGRKTSPTNEE